jgi:hypothetical protein
MGEGTNLHPCGSPRAVPDHPSGILKAKWLYIIFYAMPPTFKRAWLQGRSHASSVCASGKSRIWVKRNMKDLWNDFDRGRPKCWEKVPSPWHFVRLKCHVVWIWIEFGPPWWQAGDWPPKVYVNDTK